MSERRAVPSHYHRNATLSKPHIIAVLVSHEENNTILAADAILYSALSYIDRYSSETLYNITS
jgi:hypothetical protein